MSTALPASPAPSSSRHPRVGAGALPGNVRAAWSGACDAHRVPVTREGARLPRASSEHARAVEALAREHYEPLLRFATRLCGSPSEASDLVQDAFERALRRYDSFAPGTNARAWLYSILHHAFIDRCRRRVKTVPADSTDLAAPREDDVDPPRWSNVSAEQLRLAVDTLAPEFGAVYRMHAIDGQSYRDIAVGLGIPESTVGTRLARARQKLKTLLLAMTAEKGSDA